METRDSIFCVGDIDANFENVLTNYPQRMKVITLIAKLHGYHFDESIQTAAQYRNFMHETGLFKLIRNHHVRNLYDYLTEVEIFPNKRWDFVVRTADTIFALETNFYTDGGSKLNETARSYRLIAEEADRIDGFKFVWITDGKGWRSVKQNLRETFSVLRDLYNIKDLENGKFLELFK